jgi:hypothetical protein
MEFKKKISGICLAVALATTPVQVQAIPVFDGSNLAEWVLDGIKDAAKVAADKAEFVFNVGLKLNEMKQNIENWLYEQIPWGAGPKAKRIVDKCMKQLQIPDFNMLVNAALPLECITGQVLQIAAQDMLGTTQLSFSRLIGKSLKEGEKPRGVPAAALSATKDSANTVLDMETPPTPHMAPSRLDYEPAQYGISSANVAQKQNVDAINSAAKYAETIADQARVETNSAAFTRPEEKFLTDKQKDKVVDILNMDDGEKKQEAIAKYEKEEKKSFLTSALALNTEIVEKKSAKELEKQHDPGTRKLYIVPTMEMGDNPNKDKGAIPLTGLEICLSNDVAYYECKKAYQENAKGLKDALKKVNEGLSTAKAPGRLGEQDFKEIANLAETNGVTTISSAILAYYQSSLAMGALSAANTEKEQGKEGASGQMTDSEKLAAQSLQTKALMTQLLLINQNLADINENLSSILLSMSAKQATSMEQLNLNVRQVQRAVEMLGAVKGE